MTYEEKLKNCEDRLIPFHFTKDEWEELNKLKNKVSCAYTNVKFVHKRHHQHSPSLERIDDNLGYTKSNCIWVTKEANELKEHYIETNGDRSKLESHQQTRVKRIERILADVKNINRIREPYIKLFGEDVKEETKVVEEEHNNPINQEIQIAQMYVEFGKQIESFGSEFKLTFTQYKTLITRKRCMLTNKPLSEDIRERVLWVVDKSLPISRENVKCVDINVAKGLDFLQANGKLSVKDMITLGKNLSKGVL